MPIMAILSLAAIGACFLSIFAVGFGMLAFYRAPRPRSWLRVGEVALLALPFVVAAPFYGWVWGWFDA